MSIDTLSLALIGAMISGVGLVGFLTWDARRAHDANVAFQAFKLKEAEDALKSNLEKAAGSPDTLTLTARTATAYDEYAGVILDLNEHLSAKREYLLGSTNLTSKVSIFEVFRKIPSSTFKILNIPLDVFKSPSRIPGWQKGQNTSIEDVDPPNRTAGH